jgi:histidinol-phosphate aminotransferase
MPPVAPRPRRQVAALPRYNAGLSAAAVRARHAVDTIAKLASNENPDGCSPKAVAALGNPATLLRDYPDAQSTALRSALGRLTGIDPARIVVGNGSENLIETVCLAYLDAGDRVVTQHPCFGLHEIYPVMMGASVDKVPYTDALEFDVPAWQAALATPARIVMIANPSNPVGCRLDRAAFEAVVAAAPADALLLIDEAYYEYAVGEGFPDALAVLSTQPRPWIVLRTFSKAYGLAGARVGYGLASSEALVDALERVRTPFNVNALAQTVALAALEDPDFVRTSVARAVQEREALRRELVADGYRVAPSYTNFLFFDAGEPAVALAERLLAHGVIVKAWREPGFEHFIRVSVGTSAESQQFLAALRSQRRR